MEKDFNERLNYTFENTALFKFLGQEKAEEFKNSVIEIILQQLQYDLNDSHYYLISPNDISEIIDSFKEEIREELKEELSDKIKLSLKESILNNLNL